MADISSVFAVVTRQVEAFTQMQTVLAERADTLTPEDKEELEDYIDNQKRQCELFLKLEKMAEPEPEEPEAEPAPKPTKKKKAKPAPEPEPVIEEESKQDSLFNEADYEDLLG